MKEWILGTVGLIALLAAVFAALRFIDRRLGDSDDTDDGFDREDRP